MSFGAAEWLAAISVVVGIVVAIQSARFARSERQQDELERVYSLLYHYSFGYASLPEAEKRARVQAFFQATREANVAFVMLYEIEPLYRQAVTTEPLTAFETFALRVEEMYLTHSDYLLWHRNAESREDERFWRTLKLNGYRLLYFVHAHSMRIIVPFALFSVLIGYVQYTEEQYGIVHYSYTSLAIFIGMSSIAYIHSHPKRWKQGMNRQLGDISAYRYVAHQLKGETT